MTETRAGSDRILARLLELHPKRIDLTLGRMERLLAALGHPERNLPPVIHVAGTNGKGSVTAYLKGMIQAGGHKVHAYTSPHLVAFHERIELSGAPIAEDRLEALLAEVEDANGGEPITFFEITTAAALLAFSREPADALILEVGLGGRLDATNVVDRPKVTVITPVGLDHQEFLGPTLGQIASEKAGILKERVPCVVGPQTAEAEAAIESRAREVDAPLFTYGSDFMAHEEQGRLIYQDTDGLMDLPLPRLEGRHQVDNAAVAIAAMKHFMGGAAVAEQIAAGLRTVSWPGRLQRLKEGPLVSALTNGDALQKDAPDLWLDGGHNPPAAAVLAQAMADLNERVSRPLYLVVAMGANKDAGAFFKQFQGLARRVIAVPMPETADQHAGHAPRDLAAAAADAGLNAGIAANVADAIAQAMADAGEGDVPRVLITGSLYLVGDVLKGNA
jgi:dihydrofolate synthase/folylpolyglutamate synthase